TGEAGSMDIRFGKSLFLNPEARIKKKEQAINRAGIVQEDIQPPGLKVWSDPFGRK
uniref:Uncharacterized protein n=1 Tax=Panthera tigris altaica TaxID=74533 RepID=A0A8C9JCR0_PANTA